MLRVYHFANLPLNSLMNLTIDEIRRENLLLLLKESGDRRSLLAEKINTNPAYISQLLTPNKDNRRSLGDVLARRLEDVYKKPLGWMDTYHPAHQEKQTTEIHECNVEPGPELGGFREVPVVGSAQLGDNGYWTEIEYPVGYGDGHIKYPTKDKNAYALRCVGDSMKPRIRDGEFVVIEPNSEPIPGDEVLLKTIDGRVMVKTLLYQRNDRVHVMSINESHPPQSFDIHQIQSIHPVVAIVKSALWIRNH